MHLIKEELDRVVHQWNTHRIRCSHYTASGIPDELYKLPQLSGMYLIINILHSKLHNSYYYLAGTRDYKFPYVREAMRCAKEHAELPPPPVSLEYLQAARCIMFNNNIVHMPRNITDGLRLYILLVSTLEMYA